MIIAYLESKEQDRVALVAESTSDKSSVSKSILASKGVVGLASDLVQVDERFASISQAFSRNWLLLRIKGLPRRYYLNLRTAKKSSL